MFRQATQKALPFLVDLLRPDKQILPQYTRQTSYARSIMLKLAGLVIVIGVGAVYGRLYATLPPERLLGLLAPLAVMAVIVIWILPDRDTAPTQLMSRFLLAFFAVSIAWPDYLALQLPGLPWISFRRLFVGPMALLLLICVSTNAEFRKNMRETLSAEPWIWKLLVVFMAIMLLSIGMAGSRIPEAVKNVINYQIAWTAVFFAAAYAFRDEELPEKFLKLYMMAAIFISVIGLLELLNEAVLWKDDIPSFLQVDLTDMMGALGSDYRFGKFRVKSVYSQPLPFAEIIALVTPVTLYFIFTAKKTWHRITFIALDLGFLYVLDLPQSRLGLIGFLVAHGLFILIWAGRIWLRNKFSIVGPTITLAYPVVLLAVAAAVMSVGSLRERVMGGNDTIYSDQTRRNQKKFARQIILKRPIGYGPRQGIAAMPPSPFGGRESLDNYFLWIALDYGVLGFAAFYGMILFGIHRSFMLAIKRVSRDNNLALMVLTTLTSFVIIKGVLSEDDNHSLFYLILGMLMALLWRQKERDKAGTNMPGIKARFR